MNPTVDEKRRAEADAHIKELIAELCAKEQWPPTDEQWATLARTMRKRMGWPTP